MKCDIRVKNATEKIKKHRKIYPISTDLEGLNEELDRKRG